MVHIMGADPGVLKVFQQFTHDEWGVGVDAVPALDAWGFGYPGFDALKLAPGSAPHMSYTGRGYADGGSYKFHFPDGNATIARLLVRAMIPAAIPGHSAADVVTARRRLHPVGQAGQCSADQAFQHCRGRAQYRWGRAFVGRRHRLHAARPVAPGAREELRAGLLQHDDPVSLPGNVGPAETGSALHGEDAAGLHQRRHSQLAGVQGVGIFATLCARRLFRHHAAEPADQYRHLPQYRQRRRTHAGVHGAHACQPGLDERSQNRAGRAELLATPFETFERNIRDQMGRVLGPGGFDPARDITSITVNRWPHGYAYEFNSLFDPDWPPGQAPNEVGARASAASPSPIPMPARAPTRTSQSTRRTARCRICSSHKIA
ncbi:MAG: hypothetical protein WDN04_24950 [Rhodospirillales bacterium]